MNVCRYDIHRGYGSRSISGIARLDGMCDPWNTCTLAEGLDFTSAFIGTHELGHRFANFFVPLFEEPAAREKE